MKNSRCTFCGDFFTLKNREKRIKRKLPLGLCQTCTRFLQRRIRAQTERLIASGELVMSKVCEHVGCNKTKELHIHHVTYSKPNDVKSMCIGHHSRETNTKYKRGTKKQSNRTRLILLINSNRGKIIRLVENKHKSYAEIARMFGVNRSTICRNYNRWRNNE